MQWKVQFLTSKIPIGSILEVEIPVCIHLFLFLSYIFSSSPSCQSFPQAEEWAG